MLPRCKLITQIFILIIHEYFTESSALVMCFHHNLETLENIYLIGWYNISLCKYLFQEPPSKYVMSKNSPQK